MEFKLYNYNKTYTVNSKHLVLDLVLPFFHLAWASQNCEAAPQI